MAGGYAVPSTGDFGEIVQELRDIRRRLSELERPSGTQNVRAVAELQATVAALPAPAGFFDQTTNFSLATPVNVGRNITIPEGKTRVVFTAVGNVAALDTTSGGLAIASAFIEVNGNGFVWSSPVVPAAKDAGASNVNNIITPVLGFEQSGLIPGQSFLVNLQVSATNPSAFPTQSSNYATIAMTAIFFN